MRYYTAYTIDMWTAVCVYFAVCVYLITRCMRTEEVEYVREGERA